MKSALPSGVVALLPEGPWIAERILGTRTLGSDRSAMATSTMTLQIVDGIAPGIKSTCSFFCSDNAADELMVGQLLQRGSMPNMVFQMSDSAHSLMLAIKNGCKGDAEVDLVQSVFLTNKRPFPSVANLLRHSRRFRSTFTEQQAGDVMSVLSHLGWSPQRMTSRARTWSRAALKIDKMIQALVDEAEYGARKECALHNLKLMASYKRLMIAGMLADLTVEHQAKRPRPTPLACGGNGSWGQTPSK